jgi:putative two-component system response regulator
VKIITEHEVITTAQKLTPEEYEQMKKHSPEGARILKEILKDVDDADFKRIAVNVAHYHHERWDGKGYPDGLKGEEIPLEARIMAVADVYDALVSKRVYKDKMSFKDADRVILEGMGTQFDPGLRGVYLRTRPRLEEYYRGTDC